MNIQDFLFHAPVGRAGGTLFKNAAALAAALCERESGPFGDRKPESMRAWVSQVLRTPSDSGSRPASPNFMRELERAIRARSDANQADKNWQTASALIEELKDPGSSFRPHDEKRDWQELLKHARERETVVVMTPRPAETRVHKEKANQLRDILVDRAIIADDTVDSSPCQYEFFIVGRREAEEMIKGLIDRLASDRTLGDRSKAAGMVRKAMEGGRLKVKAIEGDHFLIPMCVFDSWDRQKMMGFVLFYHDHERASVAQMDPETLTDWRRHYDRLLHDENWIALAPPTDDTVPEGVLPYRKRAGSKA